MIWREGLRRAVAVVAVAVAACSVGAQGQGRGRAPAPGVSVVATDESTQRLAGELAPGAGPMALRVGQRLGLPLPERVLVLVAPTAPRTRDEARRLGVGEVPFWAAGIAQPERGRIVLFADRVGGRSHPSLPGTLAHEFAHLALGGNLPRGAFVPRWYDEGLAQVVERDISIYEALALARVTIGSEPPPLAELALAWPQQEAAAREAYVLSHSFVSFIEERVPPGAPRRLVEEMRRGALFEDAFRFAYGERRARLERLWRESLARRYRRIPVYVLIGLANAAMGILAVLAVVRVRRRNRRRLEEMEDEERLYF